MKLPGFLFRKNSYKAYTIIWTIVIITYYFFIRILFAKRNRFTNFKKKIENRG